MKNTTLTVVWNAEKLDVLNYYLAKKQIDLQTELNDTIRHLYEKNVPASTREYIDDKVEREGDAPEPPTKPVRPKGIDKTGGE